MILIASGAYLQGEFASEIGLLPPSFLPIGNRRLYENQIDFLRQDNKEEAQDTYISLPLSYQVDLFDLKKLKQLSVEIIRVPDGLSLGDSILFCWNACDKHYQNLTLLHGDTLFLNASFNKKNCISIHSNSGFYQRATLGRNIETLDKVHEDWTRNSEQVISGFFRFFRPLTFMKSLVEARSDFIKAIVNYHQAEPFELITEGDWLDFGHINSFFHSRTKITTQRIFNELKITSRFISKSSKTNTKKIFAEGSWFLNIPLPLKLHTPSLLGLDKGKEDYIDANYQLEYLYLLPLSDLYVFSRLSADVWHVIFKAISKVLNDFALHPPEENKESAIDNINELYLPKTLKRLNEYAKQSKYDLNTTYTVDDNAPITLLEIAEKSAQYIRPIKQDDIAISHGDLCFSNILFDARVGAIKCIDPRGLNPNEEFTIYGDRRYDLAKLYHSVIGLYDFIIAGRINFQNESLDFDFEIQQNVKDFSFIVNSFNDLILKPSGYSEKEILSITIHLFLSMLPLHSDSEERQRAFIWNAIRLFKLLENIK